MAALPYGTEGRRDILFTDQWVLDSKSLHLQEAWNFLKYLVSSDVQANWSKTTGAPPVRKSLLETWARQLPGMTPDEVEQVFLGSLKYGRESPSHMLAGFDKLDAITSAALEPIFNNTEKPADSLPAANQELITALQQIKGQYGK